MSGTQIAERKIIELVKKISNAHKEVVNERSTLLKIKLFNPFDFYRILTGNSELRVKQLERYFDKAGVKYETEDVEEMYRNINRENNKFLDKNQVVLFILGDQRQRISEFNSHVNEKVLPHNAAIFAKFMQQELEAVKSIRKERERLEISRMDPKEIENIFNLIGSFDRDYLTYEDLVKYFKFKKIDDFDSTIQSAISRFTNYCDDKVTFEQWINMIRGYTDIQDNQSPVVNTEDRNNILISENDIAGHQYLQSNPQHKERDSNGTDSWPLSDNKKERNTEVTMGDTQILTNSKNKDRNSHTNQVLPNRDTRKGETVKIVDVLSERKGMDRNLRDSQDTNSYILQEDPKDKTVPLFHSNNNVPKPTTQFIQPKKENKEVKRTEYEPVKIIENYNQDSIEGRSRPDSKNTRLLNYAEPNPQTPTQKASEKKVIANEHQLNSKGNGDKRGDGTPKESREKKDEDSEIRQIDDSVDIKVPSHDGKDDRELHFKKERVNHPDQYSQRERRNRVEPVHETGKSEVNNQKSNVEEEQKKTILRERPQKRELHYRPTVYELRKTFIRCLDEFRIVEDLRKELSRNTQLNITDLFEQACGSESSRRISIDQFTSFIKEIGVVSNPDDTRLMFKQIDQDRDGFIGFNDFCSLFLPQDTKLRSMMISSMTPTSSIKPLKLSTELHRSLRDCIELAIAAEVSLRAYKDQLDGRLFELFDLIDSRSTGSVTLEDFKTLCNGMNTDPSVQELEHILDRLDINYKKVSPLFTHSVTDTSYKKYLPTRTVNTSVHGDPITTRLTRTYEYDTERPTPSFNRPSITTVTEYEVDRSPSRRSFTTVSTYERPDSSRRTYVYNTIERPVSPPRTRIYRYSTIERPVDEERVVEKSSRYCSACQDCGCETRCASNCSYCIPSQRVTRRTYYDSDRYHEDESDEVEEVRTTTTVYREPLPVTTREEVVTEEVYYPYEPARYVYDDIEDRAVRYRTVYRY